MNRTLILAAIAAMLLGGCAGVKKPTVSVASVEPGARSEQGAVVHVTLRMTNPNGVELPVRLVHYDVALGDQRFAFDYKPPVSMPVGGGQTVRLAASFVADGLSGEPTDVSGRVYYQPPGRLRQTLTDMGVPLPHVAFHSRTTLE